MGRTPRTITKTFVSPEGTKCTCEVELFPWEKLDKVEEVESRGTRERKEASAADHNPAVEGKTFWEKLAGTAAFLLLRPPPSRVGEYFSGR